MPGLQGGRELEADARVGVGQARAEVGQPGVHPHVQRHRLARRLPPVHRPRQLLFATRTRLCLVSFDLYIVSIIIVDGGIKSIGATAGMPDAKAAATQEEVRGLGHALC